jgi:hypothetical protein
VCGAPVRIRIASGPPIGDGIPRSARVHGGFTDFDNDAAGHKRLVRWLTKGRRTARVVLESTGTYSLDVVLVQQRTPGISVMVAKSPSDQTVRRRAHAALEDGQGGRGRPGRLRHSHAFRGLGAAGRARAVTAGHPASHRRAGGGADALQATAEASAIVCNDINVNLRHFERRIELLSAQAVTLIGHHAQLQGCLRPEPPSCQRSSTLPLDGEESI